MLFEAFAAVAGRKFAYDLLASVAEEGGDALVELIDESLGAAGVEHELITYPDAPHSFFDRSSAEHADASTDAWERVLGFIEANS